MSQDSPRTHVGRRRLLAGAAAAALVGVAGCSDEDPRSDAEDSINYVPASASVLVDVDMAVTESDATRKLVESYDADDGEDYFEEFERRTGLDPEEADAVLAFADEANADDEEGTLVVEGPWDEDEVVEALQDATGAEYEETDHDAGSIYEPQGGDAEVSLGVAAEGQYVYGTGEDTRTCLDVYDGSGDGLEGALRESFEDARDAEPASTEGASQELDRGDDTETEDGDDGDGTATEDGGESDEADEGTYTQYVAAATDDPRAYLPDDSSDMVPPAVSLSIYNSLETASARYFAAEEEVALDVVMRADDEEVAREIEDFTATALTFLRSDIDDDAVQDEIAKIGVKRDGTEITVVYRTDAEGAATLVAWI